MLQMLIRNGTIAGNLEFKANYRSSGTWTEVQCYISTNIENKQKPDRDGKKKCLEYCRFIICHIAQVNSSSRFSINSPIIQRKRFPFNLRLIWLKRSTVHSKGHW